MPNTQSDRWKMVESLLIGMSDADRAVEARRSDWKTVVPTLVAHLEELAKSVNQAAKVSLSIRQSELYGLPSLALGLPTAPLAMFNPDRSRVVVSGAELQFTPRLDGVINVIWLREGVSRSEAATESKLDVLNSVEPSQLKDTLRIDGLVFDFMNRVFNDHWSIRNFK